MTQLIGMVGLFQVANSSTVQRKQLMLFGEERFFKLNPVDHV